VSLPQRVAHQGVKFARRLLIVAIITTSLMLPPPAASAATALPQPEASAHVQTYAAWSCRGVYHVVRRGETLYSIARRYGTTAYRIAVCNGLASYTVYVGQTLLVPVRR
jgi:LysM repeat protein